MGGQLVNKSWWRRGHMTTWASASDRSPLTAPRPRVNAATETAASSKRDHVGGLGTRLLSWHARQKGSVFCSSPHPGSASYFSVRTRMSLAPCIAYSFLYVRALPVSSAFGSFPVVPLRACRCVERLADQCTRGIVGAYPP